jgi:hypothetical protein
MRTRTAPWDYKQRYIITDNHIKLCKECGKLVVPALDDGVLRCLFCGNTTYIEVLESQAKAFREEIVKAHRLVALHRLQMEEFRELFALAMDRDGDPFGGDAELARDTEWLEGSDTSWGGQLRDAGFGDGGVM